MNREVIEIWVGPGRITEVYRQAISAEEVAWEPEIRQRRERAWLLRLGVTLLAIGAITAGVLFWAIFKR